MLALRNFVISNSFPKVETNSLTDEIRTSFRSFFVRYTRISRERNYSRQYIIKLTDNDAGNT